MPDQLIRTDSDLFSLSKKSVNNRLLKHRNAETTANINHQKLERDSDPVASSTLADRLKLVADKSVNDVTEVSLSAEKTNAVPPVCILEGSSKLQNRLHRIRGYLPSEPAVPVKPIQRADETVHFSVSSSSLPFQVPSSSQVAVVPVTVGFNPIINEDIEINAVGHLIHLTPAQQLHLLSVAKYIGTDQLTKSFEVFMTYWQSSGFPLNIEAAVNYLMIRGAPVIFQ